MNDILLLSIGFSPNVGGIETHFDDLTNILSKKGYRIYVLTYKPITANVKAPFFEKRGKTIEIFRIPWIGGIFYKLVKKPILEFLAFVPGLFFSLPFLLATKAKKVRVIHTHGLIAGFVGVFWGKVFGKKVISTTHSIYHFPGSGFYRGFAKWIFDKSDEVLVLSKQSQAEIESLGIASKKIHVFTYWVDLEKFKPIEGSKKSLGWEGRFTVLFVGRLVEEKGVLVLLESAGKWSRNIYLAVAGTGPLENDIKKQQVQTKNIIYLGRIDNSDLPKYYSASDLVVVPSIHEEGFGRVILESLACGTPVLGSNRGAIPEAMDNSVGKLIAISEKNITGSVLYFYEHRTELLSKSKNARSFALNYYSEKNVEVILKLYD